jgi:hypothetical protein
VWAGRDVGTRSRTNRERSYSRTSGRGRRSLRPSGAVGLPRLARTLAVVPAGILLAVFPSRELPVPLDEASDGHRPELHVAWPEGPGVTQRLQVGHHDGAQLALELSTERLALLVRDVSRRSGAAQKVFPGAPSTGEMFPRVLGTLSFLQQLGCPVLDIAEAELPGGG